MVIPPAAAYAAMPALVSVPLAFWCTVSSLELIVVRTAFRSGAPLGLDLAALVRGRFMPAILSSRLARPPAVTTMATVRLVAGVALVVVAVAGAPVAAALLFAVVAGCTAWLGLVTAGGDGADKMALVACLAGALVSAGVAAGDGRLYLAGVVWGAGQAAIAYATSGWAKLARPFWRDGSALAAIMTGYRSGHPLAAAAVRRREVAAALAWAIMLAEALFPLALVAPAPICFGWLAALAAFHFATAVVMGLNTYPWAFAATYPFVAMANALLAR